MAPKSILEGQSNVCRLAENGILAIEAFQEWHPHLIWMDLHMPQLNGSEAEISAGFDDIAFKPFRPTELFGCMVRHLGVRYRREETLPDRGPIVEPRSALAALPAALLAELHAAVVSLNGAEVLRVTEKVTEHDAALGVWLADCAQRYAYTALFEILEDITDSPAATHP